MTRIRKINQSQVEGSDANQNDANEIRPLGEMAVYINENNNNKLELLMFDGVRTHLRSKVLSKGTFYGGDSDSGDIGDGIENLDTIKLIPDAELHYNEGSFGNDQYVIIDPTLPNHIHVRAGGAIDNSSADLFLGGELTNVKVSDVGQSVTITTDAGPGSPSWKFDSNGITFPDNTVQTTAYSEASSVWVQTFETATPSTDVPQLVLSVEYDATGNIIALFSHVNPVDSSRYYSVGKYTITGTRLWTAKFGLDFYTDGWGLAVDNAGGFIYIAGSVDTDEGYSNATLTKISGIDGTIEWSKVYDFGYGSESAVVDVASDGNPVMVGYASDGTSNYVATTKINAGTGSPMWARSLDGQGNDKAYGMAIGPDEEVVSIGFMSQLGVSNAAATVYSSPVSNVLWTTNGSFDDGEVSITWTFSAGVPTFTVVYDRVGNKTFDMEFISVNGSTLGGADGVDDMLIKVGTLAQAVTGDRMLVVKYNSAGAIQWQRAVLYDEGFDCKGADADIDSAGNIYVCGQYNNDGAGYGGFDQSMSIVKFNSAGVKQWSRRIEGNCDGVTSSVVVGPDDKLYLSATTFTGTNPGDTVLNMVIAKYNLDGTVAWQRLLDYTGGVSFGNFDFGSYGSSNLAVNQNYVAVGLGFSSEFFITQARAALAQVSIDGDVFTTGAWNFKGATFSGVLSSDASDIVVVNADKIDSNNITYISTATVTPTFESSDFLIGTLNASGDASNQLVNGDQTLALNADGSVTLPQGGVISEVTVNNEYGILLTPSPISGTNPDMAVKIYPTFSGDDHIHITAGNPGTVDLFLGDDIQYVKLEQDGGNVVISADDPVGIKWTFDVNGRLTLPKNSSVREVTPATGAAANVIVIQSASSILNTSFATLPPAPISNYAVPGTGIVVNVTWSTNGEDYHAPAFTVVNGGTGHTGGGESGGGDVLTVPYADMGISGGGNWTWYVANIASDVVLAAGLESWRFAADGTTTFPDATVQTTAYLGTASTTQIGGVKIDGTTVNITDGVISLNSGLAGTVTFKGGWNASTNTPTLVNGTGTAGWMYIVTTTGTRDLGAGSETFSAGALLVYDGAVWINVSSNSGVVSFNTRTGGITLTSGDVTTALGFTPYNDTNPTGYTTNLGTVTSASVASANGFAGTVATNTTTPAITISTSITGLLKGNGTAISAASSVTDYIAPYTSQTANYVLAAPNGSAGTPVFRAGVIADISNLGTGVATFLATPTSANLAAAITDETGTNKIVFSTSPTVTTSIVTDSTSFDLLNTTATTVNFAGAATTTLTIGASGAPITGFAATATTASTASSLGYLGLPQSATATTATLAIGDTGKHIYVTTAGQTITIPANSSVAYPIGSTITFIAGPSATTVSIAISSDTMRLAGGALTGTRTLAANGMATAVKVAATTWYINGTGLT